MPHHCTPYKPPHYIQFSHSLCLRRPECFSEDFDIYVRNANTCHSAMAYLDVVAAIPYHVNLDCCPASHTLRCVSFESEDPRQESATLDNLS
jgi:hypothetical protein